MDRVEIQTTNNIEQMVDPITAQNQFNPYGIGRKTYDFVRSCQGNPGLWARIQARAAEIRANGEYGCGK